MPRHHAHPGVTAGLLTVWFLPCLAASAPETPEPLAAEVTSIWQRRCVECHGVSKQSGKLRLDSIAAALRGGKSGPAIVPGRSAESALLERVQHEARKRMPPPKKGEPLATEEIDTIRRWIESGARGGADERQVPAVTELHPERLPAGYAPVYAIAGDSSGNRLAVGRGLAVEILELRKPTDGKKDDVTLDVVTRLSAQQDLVQSLAFSLDGKWLAAGDYRAVHIWDARTWKEARSLGPHADRALVLEFSPDGKRLAVGGGTPTRDGEIKVWDVDAGRELWTATPHSDTVLDLAWRADGAVLFSGAADRVSYVLDASEGKVLRRLEGHTHHVVAVALSPDGTLAVSGGADRTLRLWDLESGSNRGDFRGGHDGPVTSVHFLPDGKEVISTGSDGTVRTWRVDNRRARRTFREARGFLQGGALFADRKLYATATQRGGVYVYDLERNRLLVSSEP